MTSAGPSLAGPGVRHVFIRDLMAMAAIGVHPHEHGGAQRVRINVDMAVEDESDEPGEGADRLARVVDYQRVVERVRAIVAAGHVKLVETLGERIATACLDDARVIRVNVRVEKLDVFADAGSVGIELQRSRKSPPS